MILCVMRIPPSPNGHGGSQRAWFLLNALCQLDRVHFILISRQADYDARTVSLEPLKDLAESVTSIDIPEWEPALQQPNALLHYKWADVANMRSQEAPRFPRAALARIASQLPTASPDMVFAGRLPTAVLLQDLLDRKHLKTGRKFADFDDILSKFRARQIANVTVNVGRQVRTLDQLDLTFIRRAERRIAANWDGVSVCTDEDVAALRATVPSTGFFKVPNVLDRYRLPPRAPDGTVRLLFVGNLAFEPNVRGLMSFMAEAWPLARAAVPHIRLSIVGINPGVQVRALAELDGVELHADVPTVEPYYAACDIVLAPILIGSGTRIKILEAMAYGRPVVSTPLGAEGLDLEDGHDLLLAESMPGFAAAIIRLAENPRLRDTLAGNARRAQQERFGPEAMTSSLREALRAAAA